MDKIIPLLQFIFLFNVKVTNFFYAWRHDSQMRGKTEMLADICLNHPKMNAGGFLESNSPYHFLPSEMPKRDFQKCMTESVLWEYFSLFTVRYAATPGKYEHCAKISGAELKGDAAIFVTKPEFYGPQNLADNTCSIAFFKIDKNRPRMSSKFFEQATTCPMRPDAYWNQDLENQALLPDEEGTTATYP